MFTQATSEDSPNATFLQALQSGHTPCGKPVGVIAELFGLEVALANLSARQAKELGFLTSGTYGQRSSTSSSSAALALSLASRLQAQTDLLGSTLYRLTWKARVTPLGRSIPALRASAHRTSDSGFGLSGWPTPNAQTFEAVDLGRLIQRRADCKKRTGNGNGFGLTLGQAAPLWLTGWPTPTATDAARGTQEARPWDTGKPLGQIVALTRTAEPARLTASGQMLTGCSAGMESGGQLSPAMSRWLMGLPPEWDEAAPISSEMKKSKHVCKQCATPLTRKRFNGRLEDNGAFRKRVFCDRSCMADWMEGQIKNMTPQNSRRQSAKTVGSMCEVCQARDTKFHVHHVDENPLNNDPSNLRTLCISCHCRSHSPSFGEDGKTRKDCVYCSADSMKRGLCFTHLSREKRHGHPLAKMRKIGSDWILMLEHGGEWFPFHSLTETPSNKEAVTSLKESRGLPCSEVTATRSARQSRKPSSKP